MIIGKATVTEKTGCRVSDRIWWRAEFDARPDAGELNQAQTEGGYSPHGYFGPNSPGSNLMIVENGDRWVATWCCSASCE